MRLRKLCFLIPLVCLLAFALALSCADDDDDTFSDDDCNNNPGNDDDSTDNDIDDDANDDVDDDTGDPFEYTIFKHDFPEGLEDTSTGDFYEPAVSYPPIPVEEHYKHALSFQMSPMMPPWRKALATNGPIVLYSDDMDVIVFSPMDYFFISLIAFRDGELQYGIEGEVESVPAGFSHRFILVKGKGINATIEHWGDLLNADRDRTKVDRYADIALSYLGYWTCTGSAYYYGTEPGMSHEETLLAVKEDADARDIPYAYMHLGSWFYFKEEGLLSPGGLILWEPKPDVFPDGLAAFQDRLGLPLLVHNRWFAIENAYRDDYDFVEDREMALPLGRDIFDHFMDDAFSWGAFNYEQDWLINQFWGVSYLRNHVNHAKTWMANIHDAVNDRGLTLMICMAGAANLMSALDLPAISQMRTSIDYHKSVSKEAYWPQFHTVNMIAWAIGVWPYKDNFHSTERCGTQEALISSLSGGMVGSGDRIGTADRELLLRTCRTDGLLLKPDKPATPIDAMFLPHQRPYTVFTHSEYEEVGKTVYLAAFHLAKEHPGRSVLDRGWAFFSYFQNVGNHFIFPDYVTNWRIDLEDDLGIYGHHVAYDWRTGKAFETDEGFQLPVTPGLYDFSYLILAPVQSNGLALIGETDKFVTLADKRFTVIELLEDGVRVQIEGVPGEIVSVKAFDTWNDRLLEEVVTVPSDGTAEVTLLRDQSCQNSITGL